MQNQLEFVCCREVESTLLGCRDTYLTACYTKEKKLCLTVGQESEQEMKQIIIMYHKNIKTFVFVPKKIMPGCILHR